MAPNSKPQHSVRLPLWIIAISLLIIAVCLIIHTLQTEPEREDQPQASSRPKKVSAGNPNPTPVAKTSRPRAAAHADVSAEKEAATVGSGSSTTEELQTASPAPDTAPPVVGGFAPVALATNATGEIVGRVTLHGKPPSESRIDVSRDSFCAQLYPEGLVTPLWNVSSNGGLANALVLIVSPTMNASPPTNSMTFQFTNCQIEPYVSTAMAGQTLRFQKADRRTHHVHVTGGGLPDRRLVLNSGAVWASIAGPISTDMIVVECDDHPWESAYVHLLHHSYAAVTDTNGDFRIASVPPGRYVVGATPGWTTNFVKLPVIVSASQITAANFTLEAPRR